MKIRTKGYGYEVDIKVSVSRPTDLLIIAYDRTREQTVHIIRRYGEDVPLLGSKIFTLPFPIEPKQLIIKVLDFRTRRSIPFQTLKIRVNNPKLMPYTHMVKKFLHFAIDFSARMGTYKVGMYRAKNDNFSIQVVDKIIDERGHIVHTPAKVYHDTGLIQVVLKDFKKLTVYNRLFVLLHEFCHYHNDTFDEVECDLFAWAKCRALGVSEYECFNSLFRVFGYIPEGSEKERRIHILFNKIFSI